MNEIPKTAGPVTPLKPIAIASVTGGTKSSGGDVPKVVKTQTADLRKLQENVEAAVAQMNEYIQSTQRDLHFSYDKASGETVVKVLDRSTQEVIRQIPDETFLKLANSADADGNFPLFSAQA